MDSTIIGVMIGGAITIIGTWLNNYHTRALQAEQWRREDEKSDRERKKQVDQQLDLQKQQITENYAEAVTHLSIFLSESSLTG